MKPISKALLLLVAAGHGAYAQIPELRWGEFGSYSNWKRYSYEIESEFEYIGRLPDLREFPKLLEAALNPKMNQPNRAIITSQLRTLSRCDFERSLNKGEDTEVAHRLSIANWKNWWDIYGLRLSEALPKEGQRYKEAWAQVAPSPYIEIPSYPILIPKSWSSTISFTSGDYGAVIEERIEFQVNEKDCWLRRCYRRPHMQGESDWVWEEWKDFSHKEANHFLASLIYLIDNPWFFSRDKLSEVEDGDKQTKIKHIRGRPVKWTNDYPSCKWTGILDSGQRVIINHDPSGWDTVDYELGPKTDLDDTSVGVVFRLVRDIFPDPSFDPDSSRWKHLDVAPNKKENKAEMATPRKPSD
jgi:hypothetical protein